MPRGMSPTREDHPPAPRWLYLHGFASGPSSSKAVALAARYAERGITLERLDARQPSLERLRLSAIVDHVKRAIGSAQDRAVLFGSSLGALAACRVAEEDPRVFALVLLAPAFDFSARFRERVGLEGMNAWRASGFLEIDDYAEKRRARVDYGFFEDCARIDEERGPWPDVRVPTLIVHGRNDEVVDVGLSRRWARGKRHVRLVEVDDGHELTQSLGTIGALADEHLATLLRKAAP
jgi:pimeloyl-ACP methyl ester carboxylesterase